MHSQIHRTVKTVTLHCRVCSQPSLYRHSTLTLKLLRFYLQLAHEHRKKVLICRPSIKPAASDLICANLSSSFNQHTARIALAVSSDSEAPKLWLAVKRFATFRNGFERFVLRSFKVLLSTLAFYNLRMRFELISNRAI